MARALHGSLFCHDKPFAALPRAERFSPHGPRRTGQTTEWAKRAELRSFGRMLTSLDCEPARNDPVSFYQFSVPVLYAGGSWRAFWCWGSQSQLQQTGLGLFREIERFHDASR